MESGSPKSLKFGRVKRESSGIDMGLLNFRSASIDPKLFEHTFNSIGECLCITDIRDNIIFVNNAFIETYGYNFKEILGKQVDILRSEKTDSKILDTILPTALKSGWQGEIYNKRKDGTDFLVFMRTSAVHDDLKNPIALVSVIKDLTKNLIFEKSLKEVEDKYRTLFAELKDAVYESTPDGKLIDINPSGVELFGFDSKEELLSVDIPKDLYLNPDDRNRFKKKLEKDGYVKNYEIKIRNKRGEERIVLETAAGVKDTNGQIKSYRGILRDITESKKSEEKLKKYLANIADTNRQLHESELKLKELNKSKDKFFSIIAHDLRSPFSSLIGLSEILLEDAEELSKKDITFYASEINTASKNVLKLLENLLQWARIQTGRMEFEPTDINLFNLVSASVSLLARNAAKKGIELINSVSDMLTVYADHNMLQSIIQNLISNAIKFTSKDGKIEIGAMLSGDNVEIFVKDDGVGISKQDLKKIFKIDQHITSKGTANEKGSGLGLILCKELAEKNNGDIRVSSEINKGSTFTLTLPREKRGK